MKLIAQREEKLSKAHSNKILRVNILGVMYEGANVCVGKEVFVPGSAIQGPVSLDYDPALKTFTTGELKPLECSVGTGT